MNHASRCLTVVLLFILSSVSGRSQAPFWEATGSPTTGSLNAITVTKAGSLFAVTDSGIFASGNQGASWHSAYAHAGYNNYLTITAASGGLVLAACQTPDGAAIVRRPDTLAGWSTTLIHSLYLVSSIAVSPVTGHIMACDAMIGDFYRSTDGGVQFDSLGNFGVFGGGGVPEAVYSADGTLIGSSHSRIFRSTDDGNTWSAVDSVSAGDDLFSLTADRFGNVAAGSENGYVFRSTDNGAHWNTMGPIVPYVTSLVISGPNTIVVGSRGMIGRGIAITTDGGTTWNPKNDGLTDTTIVALAVDSSGTLYAVAHDIINPDNVMFRSSGPILSVASSTGEMPGRFTLGQNYPNPFNPTTTISYSLPKGGHVTLSVFNMLGELVARLVDGQQNAGYHDVTFNGDGLASGVYICRIQSGSFVDVQKLMLMK